MFVCSCVCVCVSVVVVGILMATKEGRGEGDSSGWEGAVVRRTAPSWVRSSCTYTSKCEDQRLTLGVLYCSLTFF